MTSVETELRPLGRAPAVEGDVESGHEDNVEDTGKALNPVSLMAVTYFLVCGGAYGTESLGSAIAPAYALLGILIIPFVWSLPMALVTAELATSMPHVGGFIGWSKRAWGDYTSFLDGFMMFCVVICDQALYPVIFVEYMQNVVTITPLVRYLICLVFIIACCAINLAGISAMGNASKVFTFLTLLPFLAFVVCGIPEGKTDQWFVTSGENDWALYLSVLVWATCGYEHAGFLAKDVQNPARSFPIAMGGTVVGMTLTYLLPIAVALSVAPRSHITEGSYPFLADHMHYGAWLGISLLAGGLFSSAATFNAYLYTSASALFAMAADGKAPPFFAALRQYKAPVVGILFYSCTTAVMVLLDFDQLVQVEAIMYCIHAMLLCATCARLRFVAPGMTRPYRLPYGRVGAVVLTSLPVCVALLAIAVSKVTYIFAAIFFLAVASGGFWLVEWLARQREEAATPSAAWGSVGRNGGPGGMEFFRDDEDAEDRQMLLGGGGGGSVEEEDEDLVDSRR